MASPTTGTCANCGITTTKRCADCSDRINSTDMPSPTYYCGDGCQKADRQQHEGHCKTNINLRTLLERGGELLQEAFYAFREAGFDLEITGVTKDGDKLIVQEPKHDPTTGPLFRFPSHLVSTDADKKAVLTIFACGDALAYTHQLSKNIFKGTPR